MSEEDKPVWHGKGIMEQIKSTPENTKTYKQLTWDEASEHFKEMMNRKPEPRPYPWRNYYNIMLTEDEKKELKEYYDGR